MEIRLLGELALFRDGESVKLPGSRKTRALLAWLILNPGRTSRERLCELFWQVPDDPRGSLRWSLSKLRALVDDDGIKRIVADRDSVAFDPNEVTVDLLELRSQLGTGLTDLETTRLEKLARETAGGLLRGLDLNGQPEFEHFLLTERESLRAARVQILLELTSRLADTGDGDSAIPWLYDLVALDPYSVDAHVRLIELLARIGRKAEAERQLGSSLERLEDLSDSDRFMLHQALGVKAATRHTKVDEPAVARAGYEQQIRYCRAADGTRIAYAAVGDGPPLIKAANWLNHLEFDWESPVWQHLFQAFAENRTLIRYDARGNGLSDWNVDDFSLEKQVSDLEAVVHATGLDRFPLLGISQGCAVSAEFAARYPEKVTHLVLLGGYARGWNRVGTPDVIRQSEAMITLVGTGWGQDNPAFRQMFTSLFMPDAPPENQRWFNELQRMTTTPENAVKLIRANGDVDVLERLASVRTPTLVMHAEHDLRIPLNSGRELAAGIPGARFVTLPTRNHLMPVDDPAWRIMLSELRTFLDS